MPLFPIKSPPTATPDTAFWQAQLKEALTALHLPQPPLSLENFFSHPPSTLLLFSSKLQLLNCYSRVTTLEQMKHTGTVAQIRTIEMQGHCWLPSSARLGRGSPGCGGTRGLGHSELITVSTCIPKGEPKERKIYTGAFFPLRAAKGKNSACRPALGSEQSTASSGCSRALLQRARCSSQRAQPPSFAGLMTSAEGRGKSHRAP